LKKEKLGFIFTRKLDDFSHSSGTIGFMNEKLSEEYDIYPIIVKDSIIKRVIVRGIRILCHDTNKNVRFKFTPIENIKCKILINKAVKSGVKIFFAPLVSQLSSAIVIPQEASLIYLSDATYHVMINYYFFESKRSQKIGNKNEKIGLEKADKVIYSSEWASKDAIEYYGINPEKIYIVPFGANLKDYYMQKMLRDFNNGATVNILLCGVEWERKGVDIAIKSIDVLNSFDKKRKYNLTIIGLEEPKGNRYEDVTFIGRLNKNNEEEYQQLIEFYQKSDIFLLPTKAECSAIVFAEAAMYGLPIFTHITGGGADVCKRWCYREMFTDWLDSTRFCQGNTGNV
jgi:hypothetical protein